MALETLQGVTELGGFKVVVMDELSAKFPEKFNESGSMDYKWFEADIRPHNFVYVRNDVNSIAFTIQNGPVKENGVNGCHVDTLIHAARKILEGLNTKFPCQENKDAIGHLIAAIGCLEARTANRLARNVEGESKT